MHKIFHDTGIIHRDVKPNNIIIRRLSQQTDDRVGNLIGYDHAEVTSVFKTWKEMQNLTSSVDLDEETLMNHAILRIRKMPFSLAATEKILGVVRDHDVISYFLKMLARFPSRFPTNKNTEWELEDLGLTEPVSPRPWFTTCIEPERTVYGSHRQLTPLPVIYNAVHDMESFFWILVEYALIYDGPGCSERILTEELQILLYDYFDSGAKKNRIFYYPEYDEALKILNDELIAKFDEYFKPIIEGLIREWWKILYTAWQFEGFEWVNIHSHMESILMKTLHDLQKTPPPEHEFTIKEL